MATVLIADDDALIRMALRLAVEQRGHTVLEAGNSDEFFDRLAESPVGLCVMDAAMPGASLSDRLDALRDGERGAVPVAVMSGYSRPPEVVQEQGIRFLSKPLELADLDSLLTDLLRSGPGVGG